MSATRRETQVIVAYESFDEAIAEAPRVVYADESVSFAPEPADHHGPDDEYNFAYDELGPSPWVGARRGRFARISRFGRGGAAGSWGLHFGPWKAAVPWSEVQSSRDDRSST
jgi:hypothetical protein